jgi:hypothetical protein
VTNIDKDQAFITERAPSRFAAFVKSIGPGKLSFIVYCLIGRLIPGVHRLMLLVVPLLVTGLGEIYYGKDVDWIAIQEASRQGTSDKKSN